MDLNPSVALIIRFQFASDRIQSRCSRCLICRVFRRQTGTGLRVLSRANCFDQAGALSVVDESVGSATSSTLLRILPKWYAALLLRREEINRQCGPGCRRPEQRYAHGKADDLHVGFIRHIATN